MKQAISYFDIAGTLVEKVLSNLPHTHQGAVVRVTRGGRLDQVLEPKDLLFNELSITFLELIH